MTLMSREDMLRELELLPVWQLRQPLPTPFKAETPAADKNEQVVQEQAPPEIDVAVTESLAPELPVTESPVAESIEPEFQVPESLETESQETESQEPESQEPESQEPWQDEAVENFEVTSVPEPALEPVPEQALPLPVRLLLSEDNRYAFLIEPYAAGEDVQQIETLLQNMIRAMQANCRVDVTDAADKLFAVHAPELIISLGAAPANRLSGKALVIDEWRNIQQEKQPYYEQMPLIVTYHPAHLLVNTADKALAWRDLCLAMKLIQRL